MCVWKRGGYAIFLTLMGGVMQFSHLGMGGVNIFCYSKALSATLPSAEIYEQSLQSLGSFYSFYRNPV